MRIIGGAWRGRRLAVAPVEGLRPTPDRVKETLFNWLGSQVVGARCLDLFAGSGSLGFEAASRGAGEVVMVERDRQLVRHLKREATALEASTVQVHQADALSWIGPGRGRFDIVFLDPPFDDSLLVSVCHRLDTCEVLAEDALVYLECRLAAEAMSLPESWALLRSQRAGQVRYYLASPEPGPARAEQN